MDKLLVVNLEYKIFTRLHICFYLTSCIIFHLSIFIIIITIIIIIIITIITIIIIIIIIIIHL